MKLLYCQHCGVLVHLLYIKEEQKCQCNGARAKWTGGEEFIYTGARAVPIVIDEASFINAVEHQQPSMPKFFKACVEQRKSYSFKRVEKI